MYMYDLPHQWLHSFAYECSATLSSYLHHSLACQSPWQQLSVEIRQQMTFTCTVSISSHFPFSALTLLVGRHEEHLACKKLDVGGDNLIGDLHGL